MAKGAGEDQIYDTRTPVNPAYLNVTLITEDGKNWQWIDLDGEKLSERVEICVKKMPSVFSQRNDNGERVETTATKATHTFSVECVKESVPQTLDELVTKRAVRKKLKTMLYRIKHIS